MSLRPGSYLRRLMSDIIAAWKARLPRKTKTVKTQAAPEDFICRREEMQRRQWLMDHPDFVESQMTDLRRGKVRLREALREDPDKLFENAKMYSAYGLQIRQ